MKECLFGTCSDNVCAYCRLHKCNMTVKQMKCKNCLGKECWYLIKNEDHQYWRQRERTRQKRKERKHAINDFVAAHSGAKVVTNGY